MLACSWHVARWASWFSCSQQGPALPSLSLPGGPPAAHPRRLSSGRFRNEGCLWAGCSALTGAGPHDAGRLACGVLASGGFLVNASCACSWGLGPGAVQRAAGAADLPQPACGRCLVPALEGSVGNSPRQCLGHPSVEGTWVGAGHCAQDREGRLRPGAAPPPDACLRPHMLAAGCRSAACECTHGRVCGCAHVSCTCGRACGPVCTPVSVFPFRKAGFLMRLGCLSHEAPREHRQSSGVSAQTLCGPGRRGHTPSVVQGPPDHREHPGQAEVGVSGSAPVTELPCPLLCLPAVAMRCGPCARSVWGQLWRVAVRRSGGAPRRHVFHALVPCLHGQ